MFVYCKRIKIQFVMYMEYTEYSKQLVEIRKKVVLIPTQFIDLKGLTWLGSYELSGNMLRSTIIYV